MLQTTFATRTLGAGRRESSDGPSQARTALHLPIPCSEAIYREECETGRPAITATTSNRQILISLEGSSGRPVCDLTYQGIVCRELVGGCTISDVWIDLV